MIGEEVIVSVIQVSENTVDIPENGLDLRSFNGWGTFHLSLPVDELTQFAKFTQGQQTLINTHGSQALLQRLDREIQASRFQPWLGSINP
jgi:hypothetical protein